jgi:hypothetical protein
MPQTKKIFSERDANQTLQASFNDVNSTISVDGFLVGKVGRKVQLAISTTNVSNDTETYSFSEDSTVLYTIRIIYTSGARDVMLSAERIS